MRTLSPDEEDVMVAMGMLAQGMTRLVEVGMRLYAGGPTSPVEIVMQCGREDFAEFVNSTLVKTLAQEDGVPAMLIRLEGPCVRIAPQV